MLDLSLGSSVQPMGVTNGKRLNLATFLHLRLGRAELIGGEAIAAAEAEAAVEAEAAAEVFQLSEHITVWALGLGWIANLF